MRIKNGIEFVKEWKALKKKLEVYVNGYGAGQVTEVNNKKIVTILFRTGIKETYENTIEEMMNNKIDTIDNFKPFKLDAKQAKIEELKRELLRYNETIKKLEKEFIKERAK